MHLPDDGCSDCCGQRSLVKHGIHNTMQVDMRQQLRTGVGGGAVSALAEALTGRKAG